MTQESLFNDALPRRPESNDRSASRFGIRPASSRCAWTPEPPKRLAPCLPDAALFRYGSRQVQEPGLRVARRSYEPRASRPPVGQQRSCCPPALDTVGQRRPGLGFSLEPASPDADPDPGEGLSACRFEAALSPVSFASPTVEYMLRRYAAVTSEKAASPCGYAVAKVGTILWTIRKDPDGP